MGETNGKRVTRRLTHSQPHQCTQEYVKHKPNEEAEMVRMDLKSKTSLCATYKKCILFYFIFILIQSISI